MTPTLLVILAALNRNHDATRKANMTEPTPAADGYRQRIDAAIRPNMLIGLQDADLSEAGGTQRINEWADWITGAVLAVRDRRVEQLAAGRATWKAKAEEIERDRDRLAELLGFITTLAFAAPVRPEVRLSRIRDLLDPATEPGPADA